MFSKLYKFSKFVMYLNSCSMDLGRDICGGTSSGRLVLVPSDPLE